MVHYQIVDFIHIDPGRAFAAGIKRQSLVKLYKSIVPDCHDTVGIDAMILTYPFQFIGINPVRVRKDRCLLEI